jgi:hypothetical protein
VGNARKNPKTRDSGDKTANLTTQRVDYDTVDRIKNLNYRLSNTYDIRLSQCELIKYAIGFAREKEEEFTQFIKNREYTHGGKPFEKLLEITGKPWFPYGNLVKIE